MIFLIKWNYIVHFKIKIRKLTHWLSFIYRYILLPWIFYKNSICKLFSIRYSWPNWDGFLITLPFAIQLLFFSWKFWSQTHLYDPCVFTQCWEHTPNTRHSLRSTREELTIHLHRCEKRTIMRTKQKPWTPSCKYTELS